VTGRMTAKVLVAGTIMHVDNRYLAGWVRKRGALEVCCLPTDADHPPLNPSGAACGVDGRRRGEGPSSALPILDTTINTTGA
jgi:hypothetical protein